VTIEGHSGDLLIVVTLCAQLTRDLITIAKLLGIVILIAHYIYSEAGSGMTRLAVVVTLMLHRFFCKILAKLFTLRTSLIFSCVTPAYSEARLYSAALAVVQCLAGCLSPSCIALKRPKIQP